MSSHDKPPLEGPLDHYLSARFNEQEEERIWAKVRARRALLPAGSASRAETGAAPGVVLPTPIAPALLEDDGPGKSRARMWREVRARVHREGTRRRLRVAMASASLVGAAVVWALVFLTMPMGEQRAQHRSGALMVADGTPLVTLETSEQPLTVKLGDDSEIRLAARSRIEPLTSTGSRFELLLARGSAEFSVTPGGPRRWLVEAGAARVEVVGTVFRVTRAASTVRVSVSRGAVLVRGENVPGWMQRLSAGEHLTVAGKERSHAQPAQPSSGASVADVTPLEPTPVVTAVSSTASASGSSRPEPATSAGRAAARAAKRARAAPSATLPPNALSPAERYAALGPDGLARATLKATSIEELLELADIARLSGHPQEAVAPLRRALDAFRSSRQAALAAFTLGRVLLDQLNSAPPAAEAFERALVLGLPRGLRGDCYRRLAEAYERSDNTVESVRAEQRMREELNQSSPKPEAAP